MWQMAKSTLQKFHSETKEWIVEWVYGIERSQADFYFTSKVLKKQVEDQG